MISVGNPRVLLWLKAHRLTPEDIQRIELTEVRRIQINGDNLPWTAHYAIWIGKQWRAWAKTLGFVKGFMPHEDALHAGHSELEFDSYLEGKVNGTP